MKKLTMLGTYSVHFFAHLHMIRSLQEPMLQAKAQLKARILRCKEASRP